MPDPGSPVPRVVGDIHTARTATSAGVLWKLAESRRQLDANIVHLPPGQRVDPHTEPDLDVLLVALAGDGTVGDPERLEHIAEGSLLWLPRGSTRGLTAGEHGLSYLTVHQRRPGMRIEAPSPSPGD